ncbi:MAG: nonstructural protein [Microviridae sp.]|nr:MAG: nonstructural protein [Microviridae sp.]
MIFQIYSVFDDKAEIFMPPFYQSTQGQAVRVFSDATRQTDHPFHKNPGDYHLYHLGVFDDKNGKVLPLDKIVVLLSAQKVLDETLAVTGLFPEKEIIK